MWSIDEIKKKGKEAFRGNYWRSVGAAFLLNLLLGGTMAAGSNGGRDAVDTAQQEQAVQEAVSALSQSELRTLGLFIFGGLTTVLVISLLLRIFVFNPLKVGCYKFFKVNAKSADASLGVIGEGFGAYGHVFATLLLRDVFLALWGCLFVIPGIVKSYSYRMVPYIIKDEPQLSATEAITRSREMMQGNKARAFLLDLSFFGWIILSCLTLGLVGIFWLNPYYQNTDAALYLELKKG